MPADFSRDHMLERLEQESFDVLVIGGGVTGAGIALDAASRGLRTALVERDDFAAGTSSKSSKMVHGGLRYLRDDPRLVHEALRERERLRRNAPHLVTVLPFMIPILTRDGVVSRKIARAMGSLMWMYDAAGGWRIGRVHRRLRKAAALAHLPTMQPDRVAAGYVYYDAAVDDARLVLTIVHSAVDHGAVAANGCGVVELAKDASGAVTGAVVESDGRRFAIRASVVVNATGVWADEVRALDEGAAVGTLRPAKGVHITVPWDKVRNDVAVVIPVPKDKRSLFLVPWGPRGDGTFAHAYIGTTDTDYDGPLDDPQCTKDDIDYMLRAVNASITTGLTAGDITGVWAGLRPLVKDASSDRTADLSRRHRVTTSASGVITVTGGKLTTYREMAEDTVDAVAAALGRETWCRTKRLRLHGADGSTTADIEALVAQNPSLAQPLVPGLAYRRADAVYAARHEMVRSLDDVLSRRTRARLFDRDAAVAAAPDVAALVADELGWDDAEVARQVADFTRRCDDETNATRAESVSEQR